MINFRFHNLNNITMEDNSKRNYSQQSNNPQNEEEKNLETARLNVDADKGPEKFQDEFIDIEPTPYNNNSGEDAESTSGEESSYRSPEDERAYDPGNIEKYITQENPDAEEESDSNGVSSPNKIPGI